MDTPDLTPCFQETVLVWIPCAFLWIFSPVEVYKIRTSSLKTYRNLPYTLVSVMKILFSILLALIAAVQVIVVMIRYSKANETHPVQYYTPFIQFITYFYVTILMSLNRKKAINSSAVLFIFWLLFSISSGFTYYSVLKDLLNPVS